LILRFDSSLFDSSPFDSSYLRDRKYEYGSSWMCVLLPLGAVLPFFSSFFWVLRLLGSAVFAY